MEELPRVWAVMDAPPGKRTGPLLPAMVCRLQTFVELDVDDATPGKLCSMPAAPTHRRLAVERQVDTAYLWLHGAPPKTWLRPTRSCSSSNAPRSPSWTPSTCSTPAVLRLHHTHTLTAPQQAVVSRPQPTEYAFATAGAGMQAIACPSSAEVWCQGGSGVGGDCGRTGDHREGLGSGYRLGRVGVLRVGYRSGGRLTAGHLGGGRSLDHLRGQRMAQCRKPTCSVPVGNSTGS